MKSSIACLGILTLLALPLVACSAAPAQEEPAASAGDQDVDDQDGKADGASKPLGTYTLAGGTTVGEVDLELLVLLSDNRVHTMSTPPCNACTPGTFDGSYKFTKSTNSPRRYLRTVLNGVVSRYEYKMSNGKLKLKKDASEVWFTMVKAQNAWCEAADDCDLQGSITPACVGEWSCTASSCSFDCGSTPVETKCEAAGGSCVAIENNSLCDFGTLSSAEEYSCGSPGIQCCVPEEEPAPPADCSAIGCSAGEECAFCWGKYQCVPDGTMC